jgi:hypothetical protein
MTESNEKIYEQLITVDLGNGNIGFEKIKFYTLQFEGDNYE